MTLGTSSAPLGSDPATRLRVLCVDDEPHVLEGLQLHLRRRYAVSTAGNGATALGLLKGDDIAVIISDMRMPGMDGAQFLTRAREIAPLASRMLLTGQSDIDAAAAAINEGQVFRFLIKPCLPAKLLAAVDAAAEQHRLLTAERVLLEETLNGALKTMMDILAMASPTAFGRALRIKGRAAQLATRLGMGAPWQLDVAAMGSQLALITLPPDTMARLHHGADLSEPETEMIARLPAVTEQWLKNIPRLETARAIVATARYTFRPVGAEQPVEAAFVQRAAHVLRVALDFDALEAAGSGPDRAVAIMRGRSDTYDPSVLDALEVITAASGRSQEIREVPLAGLRAGMVLADDVHLVSGPMLVAKGYEVTERFVERTRNFGAGTVREPIRVIISSGGRS